MHFQPPRKAWARRTMEAFLGLAVPVFMASTTDTEQAASVPDAVASSATAYWDDAGMSSAYWADAEQAASVPHAASSSASAYCADAGSSSTAYINWDAEPLAPPSRSPAVVIPDYDRWSPEYDPFGVAEAPTIEAPTSEEPQPVAVRGMQPKAKWQPQPPKWCLPKRKIEDADKLMAFPKMKMKPPDTDEFKREVSTRSADDRKRGAREGGRF